MAPINPFVQIAECSDDSVLAGRNCSAGESYIGPVEVHNRNWGCWRRPLRKLATLTKRLCIIDLCLESYDHQRCLVSCQLCRRVFFDQCDDRFKFLFSCPHWHRIIGSHRPLEAFGYFPSRVQPPYVVPKSFSLSKDKSKVQEKRDHHNQFRNVQGSL